MSLEKAWIMLVEISERTCRIEDKLHLLDQPKEQEDIFLNVEAAATVLGIKVSTLYGKVSRREVPYFKRGKLLQFDKADLIDWVRAGRKKTHKERLDEAQEFLNKIRQKKR